MKCLFFLSISILAIESCKKTDPRPAPTAAFTWANAGEGIVQFTDGSKEADTYAWDFGNGMTSTEKSPKHDYGKNGKFTVTLTVKNESGDNKTSQTVDVSSIPAPKTDFTVALGADGLATFTNASTGATTYAWDFGDGTTSTETSPKKTYTKNGTYTVKLTATGKGGAVSVSKSVVVAGVATTTTSIVGKWLPQLYEGTFVVKKSTGEVVTVNARFDATKPSPAGGNVTPVEYLSNGQIKDENGAVTGTYKITGTTLQTTDSDKKVSELQIAEVTATKLVLKGDFSKLSESDKGGFLLVLLFGDPNAFSGVNTNKDTIQSGTVAITSKKI